MSLLERETSLLNGQIKEISNALSQFNKNGLSASQEANVPSSALTLMMIDNQIEQHRSRMERLQLRVEVAIPQSRSDLQVNLEDSLRKSLIQEKIVSALDSEIQFKQAEHERAVAQLQNSLDEFVSVQAKKNTDIERQIEENQQLVSAAENQLRKFKLEREFAIESQKQVILEAKAKLNELRDTRTLGVAVRSVDPKGQGKAIILALSAVLGLMAGTVLAFAAEFVSKARRQGLSQGF